MEESLQLLVAGLLKWILREPQFAQAASVKVAPPIIRFVPQEAIARVICGQPCGVRAYHLPGSGIFLDAALDPVNDMHARSILLHELVHHVQAVRERFVELSDCERNRMLEREAYTLQNEYLQRNASPVRVANAVYYECSPETVNSATKDELLPMQ